MSKIIFDDSWEEALENILKMARSFLNSDLQNVRKLKNARGFAVGFVDGNLEYVK